MLSSSAFSLSIYLHSSICPSLRPTLSRSFSQVFIFLCFLLSLSWLFIVCCLELPAFVHMGCNGYYTVVIIPLQNSLNSPDALHCFHWLKRRRDLERQKDILWAELQVVEQTKLWYQNRLKLNLQREVSFSTGDLDEEGRWSCASLTPEESRGSDCDLRWSNATLAKEVNWKNQQISMLELEKAQLLQQLLSYSTPY